jgi:hypothetical protein
MIFAVLIVFVGGIVSVAAPWFVIRDTIAKSETNDHLYVLEDASRPTHWKQSQWDTLNDYLKRVDELESRVKKLEGEQ